MRVFFLMNIFKSNYRAEQICSSSVCHSCSFNYLFIYSTMTIRMQEYNFLKGHVRSPQTTKPHSQKITACLMVNYHIDVKQLHNRQRLRSFQNRGILTFSVNVEDSLSLSPSPVFDFEKFSFIVVVVSLQKTTIYKFSTVLCSIMQKATNALELLKEVLDAIEGKNSEVCFYCYLVILNSRFLLLISS